MPAGRVPAWLAGVWAGWVIGIGFVAAPVVFAVAARPIAGLVAGRLFAVEGAMSLVCGAAWLWTWRRGLLPGQGRPDAALWLALAALFCTVAGQYGLPTLMPAAREGRGPLSFAAVHGAASALYGAKALLVMALAWRLTAGRSGRGFGPA